MATRTLDRIGLVAALLLVAAVVFSATQPPLATCGGLESRYPPILAFEFVRSIADLHAIFGATPSACRTALVAKFDFTNWADTALFIPIYGAFLVFSLLGLRARHPTLARAAVVCAIVACAADYVENACLLQLSADPDHPTAWLALLPWATGVKWLLLAVAGVLGGWLVSARRNVRTLLGALCLGGLVVVALGQVAPHAFGRFASAGVGVSWLILLVADLMRWRSSRQGLDDGSKQLQPVASAAIAAHPER